MAITSTVLANGQQSDIAHYNNLRSDLLTEHDHTTGKGDVVSHGSLSDGVIISPTNTRLTHEQLNIHVQGAGVSATPDDPGGSQGVHGLPPTAYITGCLTAALVLVIGQNTTDDTVAIVGGGGEVDQTTTAPVSFGSTFTAAPCVIVTCRDTEATRVSAYGATTTGFYPRIGFSAGAKATGQYSASFDWFAVGVLA